MGYEAMIQSVLDDIDKECQRTGMQKLLLEKGMETCPKCACVNPSI